MTDGAATSGSSRDCCQLGVTELPGCTLLVLEEGRSVEKNGDLTVMLFGWTYASGLLVDRRFGSSLCGCGWSLGKGVNVSCSRDGKDSTKYKQVKPSGLTEGVTGKLFPSLLLQLPRTIKHHINRL